LGGGGAANGAIPVLNRTGVTDYCIMSIRKMVYASVDYGSILFAPENFWDVNLYPSSCEVPIIFPPL
jgi:hypothetical protein